MMTSKTYSQLVKAIIIGTSIGLGSLIAFKLFRPGIQEIAEIQDAIQTAQPMAPTQDELTLEGEKAEQAYTNMPEAARNALEAEARELDNVQEHMQKEHQTAQPSEAPCSICKKHVDQLNEQETRITKPIAKKPVAKKSSAPKAPEKKQAPVKQHESADTKKPAAKRAEPAQPAMPEEKPAVAKPMVTVKNKIQKKMTGYKKFGKTWCPDDYSLTINGVEVAEGETINVPADTKCINLVFAYDFRPMGKSYKKGTEELTYQLLNDTKELEITFSWYEKPTLMVTRVKAPANNNL